jgi:hypothetical protein
MAGEAVVTQERSGQVPRYYVACLNDRALPIEAQRELIRRHPCRQVATLDSDHSPFLCRPAELAEFLLGVAFERPTRERR